MQLRLDRARAIQGWMNDPELKWLARMATRHYRIAEVGSWKGRSTVALAENTKGMVFAIDTWKGSPEHSADQVGPEGWLFEQFSQNVKGLPIIPIMGTSLAAAKHFRDGQFRLFDMIFIDAAHDAESVRADIVAWWPLLQPGALMCGHDYGTWPGLDEAVKAELGRVKVRASIWYTYKERL